MNNSISQTKFRSFFIELCFFFQKWIFYSFTLGLGIYALIVDWDQISVMKISILITYLLFQTYLGFIIKFREDHYKQRSITNMGLLFFDVLILLKINHLWIYALTIWIISWAFMVDFILYSKKPNNVRILKLKQMWQAFIIFWLPASGFVVIFICILYFGDSADFIQTPSDGIVSLGITIFGLLGIMFLFRGRSILKSFIETKDTESELNYGRRIFF